MPLMHVQVSLAFRREARRLKTTMWWKVRCTCVRGGGAPVA